MMKALMAFARAQLPLIAREAGWCDICSHRVRFDQTR